jgi:CheY-like chemotaxis protein
MLQSFTPAEMAPVASTAPGAGPIPPGTAEGRPRAFVVDDDDLARRALTELLGDAYEVQGFETGEAALEALPQVWPDVVLLDVVLPGLDGLEVCRRMKTAAVGHPLAVLLVTGHQPRDGRNLAQQAGADDFLLKPVTRGELRSRVRTLARMVWHQRQHARAEHQVEELKAQLERAQRLATLGSFARGIGHEMNNVGTVLKSALDELSRTRVVDGELIEELQQATGQLQGLAGAVQRLAQPSQTQVMLDVRTVVNDVVSLARLTGRTKYVVVRVDLPHAPALAALSAAQAQTLVLALLTHAADALATVSAGCIRVGVQVEPGEVVLSVEDNGPGLDLAGLDEARALLAAWGGALEVKRRPGAGTLAVARFPSERAALPT